MSLSRSDSGNQICSHAGRMPEQDKSSEIQNSQPRVKVGGILSSDNKRYLYIIMY